MPNKKRDLIAQLEQYPANIRDKAERFYWRNVHVFNSKTHKLNGHIQGRDEAAQVLMVVEILGRLHDRIKRLNADERKCLDGIGTQIQIEKSSSEK